MAILKDLLQTVSFSDVWNVLCTEREDKEVGRADFEALFQNFQSAAPAENDAVMRIVLEMAPDFWDDAEYLQVCGYLPDDDEPYALGVKPVEELVGFTIDPETLNAYSPTEIVAHCLSEFALDSSTAHAAWNIQADSAAVGLYDSVVCMDSDTQDASLDEVRQELGLKETEDNKDNTSKYGFLF